MSKPALETESKLTNIKRKSLTTNLKIQTVIIVLDAQKRAYS